MGRTKGEKSAGSGRTRGWKGTLSRFGEYLQKHDVPRDAIAKGCVVTPSYISMLAHGKAKPGFGLARAIEAWTRANVVEAEGPAPFTCADWELTRDSIPGTDPIIVTPEAPAA